MDVTPEPYELTTEVCSGPTRSCRGGDVRCVQQAQKDGYVAVRLYEFCRQDEIHTVPRPTGVVLALALLVAGCSRASPGVLDSSCGVSLQRLVPGGPWGPVRRAPGQDFLRGGPALQGKTLPRGIRRGVLVRRAGLRFQLPDRRLHLPLRHRGVR